jgi:Family of unknown function (DUF6146)
MRILIFIFLFSLTLFSCKSKNVVVEKNLVNSSKILGDTVKIANEKLEYEVIIIDVGFVTWLNTRAFPRNYLTESFMENKNQFYVSEWNRRVINSQQFDPNLYEMNINYDSSVHYGYEVNYLIYNYMVYFQNTYKQRLFGFVPTR